MFCHRAAPRYAIGGAVRDPGPGEDGNDGERARSRRRRLERASGRRQNDARRSAYPQYRLFEDSRLPQGRGVHVNGLRGQPRALRETRHESVRWPVSLSFCPFARGASIVLLFVFLGDSNQSECHQACNLPRLRLESDFRFELEVERGHGATYYSEMASENNMDKLQLEVVKLNDELAEILNEADYMKEKEVKFHKKVPPSNFNPRSLRLVRPSTQAERINLAAIWWPILQIAILALTATFQVQNLKGFFQSKHLY